MYLFSRWFNNTGAIEAVKAKTASLSESPRIIALLIFWFFALFGEGLAGLGTPVALTAPFHVAIGFSPVDSVAVALMGHSVGASFGAVGTGGATVGMVGKEGSILGKTMVGCLVHSMLGGLVALRLAPFQ